MAASYTRGAALAALAAMLGPAGAVDGQVVRGRVVESTTAVPVPLAGVFLLDARREVAETALADTLGRYAVRVPGAGEYYLLVQRLGYFETESPLVALGGGTYELDFEVRPEPIRLDPLRVTVRNEEMERHLTLELGENPNSMLGFRAIQGATLEEARFVARDNTDLLTRLYVGISHREAVCMGHGIPRPERGTGRIGERPCGKLFVDGIERPAEHVEEIAMEEIAVVVVIPPDVRLYTYGFDWTLRPGPRRWDER